jgi:hypothetical protein
MGKNDAKKHQKESFYIEAFQKSNESFSLQIP